ncbi:16S rRNA (guanine(966)-N(2))-methyltransferase RsmD [cyanobiont of Ornithocercus magnificus]|nr:16S rRNA (guanine(966)-N(2))-methyltransferase RsmD [cyanobiont of Ornithocercus magnificus]
MVRLRLTGGRRLRSPIGQLTRPTTARVREAVMNILGSRLNGSSWLDICSGSGAVACEALQRGAQDIVAVEKDRHAADICRMNLETVRCGLSGEICLKVVQQDAIRWLASSKRPKRGFDFVYFDPPYWNDLYKGILDVLLAAEWVDISSLVICEHATDLQLVTPPGWHEYDRRQYGDSSLLFLSQPPRVLPLRY